MAGVRLHGVSMTVLVTSMTVLVTLFLGKCCDESIHAERQSKGLCDSGYWLRQQINGRLDIAL